MGEIMMEDPELHQESRSAVTVSRWLPPEAPLDMPRQVLERAPRAARFPDLRRVMRWLAPMGPA